MPLQLLGESSWRPRPKYLLFGLIGLMMLTVINRDRALLNPHAPTWEHYRYFRWWLLPHGIAGSLALFLGPLQFSNKLRRRFLPWHRIIGRIYVCGVAVAVPVGIWIEYIKSLASGHKSKRISWLALSSNSDWESNASNTCKMGTFSRLVMLKICRIW
jgi:hypothetical protein